MILSLNPSTLSRVAAGSPSGSSANLLTICRMEWWTAASSSPNRFRGPGSPAIAAARAMESSRIPSCASDHFPPIGSCSSRNARSASQNLCITRSPAMALRWNGSRSMNPACVAWTAAAASLRASWRSLTGSFPATAHPPDRSLVDSIEFRCHSSPSAAFLSAFSRYFSSFRAIFRAGLSPEGFFGGCGGRAGAFSGLPAPSAPFSGSGGLSGSLSGVLAPSARLLSSSAHSASARFVLSLT